MATEEEAPDAAAAPAPAGGAGDDVEMPEAAAPSDSDSDSSDSDDEDDGAGGADELRIQALEQALQAQPLDYETHVQYIQCLRKSGNIEKLRAAREEMNKYFPLTPKMWQEWAKDEITLRMSEESFGDIEKLYERGVQEYLSIKLWRDYLDFVEEHDPSVSQCTPSGLSKMRDLFERAITAGGLHVAEGSKLWSAYREYEMAILITITDGNDEEKAKQVQRIRTLFHRQLSVPLAEMESTLSEYKSWEAEQGNANDPSSNFDGVPSNVISAYKKANDMYNERKQYEDQLNDAGASEADKLQEFLKYLKFEESSGDPARVQVLYERAVSELPVSKDLWIGYTSYLDRSLKVLSETCLGILVFERAVQCSFATVQEDICHAWIRFEEEHGTLDDYDLAVKKVTPRLKELMVFKSQEEAKLEAYSLNDNSTADDSSQKRKASKMANKQQPAAKKRKENPPKSAKSSDVQGSKTQSGHSGVVTAVEVGESTREKVEASTEMKVDSDSRTGNTGSNEPKSSFYTDKCTVFVSNIDLKANEDDLRRFFSDIGGATAIRLLKDKFTKKSRGLAYVDFSDNKHLEAALRKNKQKLLGKKVSIARSDPSKSKKSREAGPSSTGHDNLPQSGDDGAKAPGSRPDKEVAKDDVKITGKNTFFAPRSVVKPLGWTTKDDKTDGGTGELKSNEEFRNLLLKK
nr:unnamed protein product [Digitaria exilis]